MIYLNKIIGLLLLLPTFVFGQQPSMPDGWSDGYAFINGVRLHYYRAVAQKGKPVMVMVHGVTDNGLCWATLATKFQDEYDIYMLDARGHGLSDPFMPGDNGETLVKDVVSFVKSMEFHSPILIGHSMGAAIVLRVGAEYPEVSRAIVMIDPLLGRIGKAARSVRNSEGDHEDKPNEKSRSSTSSNRISVSMFGSPETLVAQNNYSYDDLVSLGRRQNPLWDELDIAYWALSKKQYHGPYSDAAAQAMTGTMQIGNSLEKIFVPAIILKADASAEARKANEQTAAALPNGKLIHIDGGGHNLHHDKLERTTEVLREFLSTF